MTSVKKERVAVGIIVGFLLIMVVAVVVAAIALPIMAFQEGNLLPILAIYAFLAVLGWAVSNVR